LRSIVPAGLGDRQPVADEHHLRFQRAVEFAAGAERGVLPNRQRLLLAITDERERGLSRHECPALEPHRLPESVDAGRLQADRLKLALDIFHGLVIPRRADIAALEFVVGQKQHVRPPALAFGGQIGGLRGRAGDTGGGKKTSGEKSGFHRIEAILRQTALGNCPHSCGKLSTKPSRARQ
jgi:hypothetical protein